MKELTLKVEHLYGIDEEFNLYMLDLNGIEEVKVEPETLDIYIKYDENKISINRIKLETMFFLGINNIPSLRAFNKHSKEKLTDYVITIESVCCEYCFRGMIEELFAIDGIDKADSDYDYVDYKNIGTHSLRKTFGYHIWHNAEDKEKALVMLMAIFNHSSVAMTKKYIGIMDEEIEDIFNGLNLGLDLI